MCAVCPLELCGRTLAADNAHMLKVPIEIANRSAAAPLLDRTATYLRPTHSLLALWATLLGLPEALVAGGVPLFCAEIGARSMFAVCCGCAAGIVARSC